MPILQGQLCALRPLRATDSTVIVKWRNDPATRRNIIGYRMPISAEMEAAWVDRIVHGKMDNRAVFAITEFNKEELVGMIQLMDIDLFARSTELGIVIGDAAARGRRIGAEAVQLAITYAFGTLNLRRIAVRYLATNDAAQAMFRGLGFSPEGRLRQAAYDDSVYIDVELAGLVRQANPHAA